MDSIMDKLKRTSRDNARTPMQWSDDKYAGFSTVLPIQKEVSNYINVNVKKQESDEKSILNTYQKLTHLRRFSDYSDVLTYGKFKLINPDDENVFAYERYDSNKKLIIITNFRSYTVPFDYQKDVRIVYSNYDRTDKNVTQLEPFEALILEKIYD
jgi:glycosidase